MQSRFFSGLRAFFSGTLRWHFAAMAGVLALAVVAAMLVALPFQGLALSGAKQLDEGWSYVMAEEEPRPLGTLPASVGTVGSSLTLRHAITPELLQENEVLALASHYASIQVWADDFLIYASQPEEARMPTSLWHFIPVSDFAWAETLTVTLHSYTGATTYWIDAPYLDSPIAIQHDLIEAAGVGLWFSGFCLLLAVGLLVCAVILWRARSPVYAQLLPLAAFVFLSGLWIFLDTKITHIYSGNLALSYLLNHATFFLLPAPYLLYIRLVTGEHRRLIGVLFWATIANAACGLLLYLCGLLPLLTAASVVHGIIFLAILTATHAFWRSVVQRREKGLRLTFVGMLIVYGCVFVSVVRFYQGAWVGSSAAHLYILGLALMLLCMAADALALFVRFWHQKENAERYRRLAMEDSMTGLANRNAFQLHWQALLAQPPRQLAIIVFDVDDLKQINDRLGHADGDAAITAAARQIRAVFDTVGSCYRTGGDEFEVIVEGRATADIPELLTQFAQALPRHWDQSLPSAGVSYGWAAATFSDTNPLTETALVRLRADADHSLYTHKTQRKAPT